MADGICGLTDSFGVIEEATLPGIVCIHPLQDFAQARCAPAGLAHLKVQHHTEQFAFVVVGDAALGMAVIAVALEPGIEAGFLRRLCEVCRTALKFRDLLTESLQVLLLIQQTSPQLDRAFGGAGDAFAEPKRPRVILFRSPAAPAEPEGLGPGAVARRHWAAGSRSVRAGGGRHSCMAAPLACRI